jgi:hypothetical protein
MSIESGLVRNLTVHVYRVWTGKKIKSSMSIESGLVSIKSGLVRTGKKIKPSISIESGLVKKSNRPCISSQDW